MNWDNKFLQKYNYSEEFLNQNGTSPYIVGNKIKSQLSEQKIYSSNPGFDFRMLNELFITIGEPANPIKMMDMDELFESILKVKCKEQTLSLLNKLKLKARKINHDIYGGAWEMRYYDILWKQVIEWNAS
jgi:hypothetical protein